MKNTFINFKGDIDMQAPIRYKNKIFFKLGKILCLSITALFILLMPTSCQDEFLLKPVGSDTNVDSVFSKKDKAISAISQSYALCLATGIPVSDWVGANNGMNHGTLDDLCGDMLNMFNWEDGYWLIRSGMSAAGRNEDNYDFHWKAVRQAYLVFENIDKVSDYSDIEKNQIKSEMKALVAYQYLEMFKRYGGVPIVKSTLKPTDNVRIPRASIQETLDFIVELCNSANNLPDVYSDEMKGRLTAGIPLAIKAEAYIYAARPLFNSSTPYLDMGENNKLICFGNYDSQRWQAAADASKAVVEWSLKNNYMIINTGSPLDDYGNATSTPNNAEVLLAYNFQKDFSEANNKTGFYSHYNIHYWDAQQNFVSFSMLSKYYKADGTDQTWAGSDPKPFSEYVSKMQEMEPRLKASVYAFTIQPWNNPGDQTWAVSNFIGDNKLPGCALSTKFWYKAGNRLWMNYPIYRLAEFYLNMAEAYNEVGNNQEALTNLNVIRKRAGLPDVTETDKGKLREIIQREWAVEFFRENHRFHDVKHWKLTDLNNGVIGGDLKYFTYTFATAGNHINASDYNDYKTVNAIKGFWNPNQYLNPFPQAEINKKYLIQNPGY
ncbi:MAG: RagB/SusD family nutrient uptake outer membrane protein [Paludibacter sp.]|nr:RagB/SusD family nutrient uptake outer membrane protein [Paludibacter sp.]